MKRKAVVFHTKSRGKVGGNGSFNSSRNSTLSDKNLRRANKQLAKELNAERMKNATLRNDIVELRNELLTQGEELSDLRTVPQRDPLLVEVEFQKRLAEYMEPLKTCLNLALDHTSNLTNNLDQALRIATQPKRRSESLKKSMEDETSFVAAGSFQHPQRRVPFPRRDTGDLSLLKRKKLQRVTPLVSGHAIHSRPKVNIQRLDLNDLNNLIQNENLRIQQHEEPNTMPQELNNDPADEHLSSIGEEIQSEPEDDQEESSSPIRTSRSQSSFRPRRASFLQANSAPQGNLSPVVLLEDVSGLIESFQSEELSRRSDPTSATSTNEPNNGETVLLVPRLVLERVTLTPGRSVAASSTTSSSVAATPVKVNPEPEGKNPKKEEKPTVLAEQPIDDTPIQRETNTEFMERMLNIDAMEGPSWMFEEDDSPQRMSKNIRKRRQSVRVRRSSCAKRLVMKDDNEDKAKEEGKGEEREEEEIVKKAKGVKRKGARREQEKGEKSKQSANVESEDETNAPEEGEIVKKAKETKKKGNQKKRSDKREKVENCATVGSEGEGNAQEVVKKTKGAKGKRKPEKGEKCKTSVIVDNVNEKSTCSIHPTEEVVEHEEDDPSPAVEAADEDEDRSESGRAASRRPDPSAAGDSDASEEPERGSRRRRATSVNYAEPSIRKKLRQGDPISTTYLNAQEKEREEQKSESRKKSRRKKK